MKLGIIGLPNVGKTTFFNALSKNHAPAENYPFCTIDPNIASVPVPDSNMEKLAELVNPRKIIHATVDFVDIAGLVKDAHKGEGLGNQFLGHIRDVEALTHIIRCFEADNVSHMHGTADPLNDCEIIDTELIMADLQTCDKRLSKVSREARSGNHDAQHEQSFLEKIKPILEAGMPLRRHYIDTPPSHDDIPLLKECRFLTAKPVMYIVNMGETFDDRTREWIDRIKEYAAHDNAEVLPICAEIEAELSELEPDDRRQFIEELGIDVHGLGEIVQAGYRLLNYITFYTIVSLETRAWAVTQGTTAPEAAGQIHTDMERGFIRADVVQCDKLLEYGSIAHAREHGVLLSEGRNYEIRDNDIVYIHFKV